MPLLRLAGKKHRVYTIGAGSQFAAAAAANAKQNGGEGYIRKAILSMPILIQPTSLVLCDGVGQSVCMQCFTG